jgi:hypothetical protein
VLAGAPVNQWLSEIGRSFNVRAVGGRLQKVVSICNQPDHQNWTELVAMLTLTRNGYFWFSSSG